jgi:hypothetical protein
VSSNVSSKDAADPRVLQAGMSSKAADMSSNAADMSGKDKSSKDPMMLKAGELKAGIVALGGSPAGLIEKSELVALYRQLLEQAKGSISSD